MDIATSDPAVQAAIISAVGSVVATLIAGCAAAIIGQRFANQEKLRTKIKVLQDDLLFLWAVQQEYSRRFGEKINVRDAVRAQGYLWSGRFSPAKHGGTKAGRESCQAEVRNQLLKGAGCANLQ